MKVLSFLNIFIDSLVKVKRKVVIKFDRNTDLEVLN